jgi:ABC-2 type transport system permease protein
MARLFARLKLVVYRNQFRRSTSWATMFVVSVVLGLMAAPLGLFVFAGAATVEPGATAVAFTGLVGSAMALCWVLFPLLAFGVDNTVDPTRFALLPLRRGELASGMLAAALVGLAPLVSLIMFAGTPVGTFASGGGPAATAVGALGALLALLTCVLLARATTSVLASALTSRRGRDLVVIAAPLVGVALYPVALNIGPLLDGASSTSAQGAMLQAGSFFGWTPLGWAFTAGPELAAGRPLAAVAKLALAALFALALVQVWVRAVERQLINPPTPSAGPATTSGAGLFAGVATVLPRSQVGAVAARDLKLWWRDPRRKAQLFTALGMGTALSLFIGAPYGSGIGGGAAYAGLAIVWFAGASAANAYGYEGTAYWQHVAVGGTDRADAAGRLLALALLTLPGGLLIAAVLSTALGTAGSLPGAIGLTAAVFGSLALVNSVAAVRAPRTLPNTTNPWAATSSGGMRQFLAALAGMAVTAVLVMPLVLVLILGDGPGGRWLVLAGGLAEGALLAWLTVRLTAAQTARRGPELLAALTATR